MKADYQRVGNLGRSVGKTFGQAVSKCLRCHALVMDEDRKSHNTWHSEQEVEETDLDLRPQGEPLVPKTQTETWLKIVDSVERVMNSCYGTDERHAMAANAVAQEVVFDIRPNLQISHYFGRLT
jgi:hypothetical protein